MLPENVKYTLFGDGSKSVQLLFDDLDWSQLARGLSEGKGSV